MWFMDRRLSFAPLPGRNGLTSRGKTGSALSGAPFVSSTIFSLFQQPTNYFAVL